MNILIINQPPFNRGDESAHKGLVRSLLNYIPDVHIKVMSNHFLQESVRQYAVHDDRVKYIIDPYHIFHFEAVQWHGMHKGRTWLWYFHPTFRKYKRIYEWADVVVCAPGGICMGGFQDWNHLFYLKLAKFYHRPLAYYGRSFGPFPTETEDNRRFREISLEMLHYFSFLSIRDHKSELLADELGISYVPTVDSAFLDSPKVEIPYELKSAIGETPYMVFVPNYLLWHYAYKKRISHETVISFYCQVLDEIWSINPELNVVMLPQTFCGHSYALRDVDFFRDIAKKKNDKRIIVATDCYSSDIQQSVICKAKYVIGARYHSIVFAINQGVPCIALSYEHKISGLLESLDKSEWCIDFSKTLDSMTNQQKCLTEISSLISNLTPDSVLANKAKSIAYVCMGKFIDSIKNI